MAFLIPNVAKPGRLDRVLVDSATWEVCLYSNSVTWSNATVLGDITESAFTGYLRKNPVFPGAALVSNKGSSTAAALSFTITSGTATAVGYFLLDVGGNLLGGEAFAAPVAFDVVGVATLLMSVTQTEDRE